MASSAPRDYIECERNITNSDRVLYGSLLGEPISVNVCLGSLADIYRLPGISALFQKATVLCERASIYEKHFNGSDHLP
jgi:hypothetical protein